MKKWIALLLSIALVGCSTPTKKEAVQLKKVDFILDWTPNTNHTGLFVAVEKGYLKEVGIDLTIQQPPEGSTTELIANNKAPFGISFQDTMAKRLAKKAEVSAVAAIIEHNTSGIISLKDKNITTPKDLAGKKYGTWNDPIELAMIQTLMTKENGKFEDVQLVPNEADNSIVGLTSNMFDAAWVYYAWDGFLAKDLKQDTNFFLMKDFSSELDYYSPVIIASNQYLKENKAEAKKIMQAIKKGYQFAMENPEESAKILIKHAPELKAKEAFVIESQKWISSQYASDKSKWGYIDASRWNAFYEWINQNGLVKTPIEKDYGFTNELLGE